VQVFIPPKIRRVLIVVFVLLLAGIGTAVLWPQFIPPHESAPVPTARDAEAATRAVQAFYSLDESEGIDGWIARVCATATEKGCIATKNFYAPAVQALVLEKHIRTNCTTRPIQLISDKGDIRTWEVQVSLTHPWADLKTGTQNVYVEVSSVDGQWLMNRILFEQEAGHFTTPTPE
jgi:hypothetical protein